MDRIEVTGELGEVEAGLGAASRSRRSRWRRRARAETSLPSSPLGALLGLGALERDDREHVGDQRFLDAAGRGDHALLQHGAAAVVVDALESARSRAAARWRGSARGSRGCSRR